MSRLEKDKLGELKTELARLKRMLGYSENRTKRLQRDYYCLERDIAQLQSHINTPCGIEERNAQ